MTVPLQTYRRAGRDFGNAEHRLAIALHATLALAGATLLLGLMLMALSLPADGGTPVPQEPVPPPATAVAEYPHA